jgi:hypothetical protein
MVHALPIAVERELDLVLLGAIDARSYNYQRLVRQLLEAQRAEIIRLRNQGKINDEIMHRIERDLDLEDTRLEV